MLWQLETIGQGTHVFAHLERPIVLGRELGIAAVCDAGGRTVVETQQRLVAGRKLGVTLGLVKVFFM